MSDGLGCFVPGCRRHPLRGNNRAVRKQGVPIGRLFGLEHMVSFWSFLHMGSGRGQFSENPMVRGLVTGQYAV